MHYWLDVQLDQEILDGLYCVCLWKITSHFSSLRFSIECMNKSFELRERKQLPPTFNTDRDRFLRKSSRNYEYIFPLFCAFFCFKRLQRDSSIFFGMYLNVLSILRPRGIQTFLTPTLHISLGML